MTEQTNDIPQKTQDTALVQEEFITLRDLMTWAVEKWYWFVAAFVAALIVVGVYLMIKEPVYNRYSELLVKEDSHGASISDGMNAFDGFGLFQSNLNVNNEIIALKSPAVMAEVVGRLHLDVTYSVRRLLRRETLYGVSSPVMVSLPDAKPQESLRFDVHLLGDSTARIDGFAVEGEEQEGTVICSLGDTAVTPAGRMIVTAGAAYGDFMEEYGDRAVRVTKSDRFHVVEAFVAALSVGLSEEKSSVVNLSINDRSIQRAEDVLNSVVTVYNELWVKDKNRVAAQTSLFIDERLRLIENELSMVDNDISQFKSRNMLPDIKAATDMYMQQFSTSTAEILELNNRLQMARYLGQYLASGSRNDLLPANSGIESLPVEKQIEEYNALWFQRNSLASNSSEENPLVADMSKTLAAMRSAITSSVESLISTLELQMDNMKRNEVETVGRLSDNPGQAKYLLSVERQQAVKEALYIYLLQKREENELSRTFTAYNTRVITPPYGSDKPVEPRLPVLLFAALIAVLVLPTGIYVLMQYVNTTVRGKRDLEGISAPLVGEIPQVNRKKGADEYEIVVRQGRSDVVNEALRVARTNLEFMLGREGHKVLMATSYNPGSGKTYITANLAVSFAIKGKRVLLIDLDLRRATMSRYASSPKRGVATFLSGMDDGLDGLICRGVLHENVDILPVGVIPPNPTELLSDSRFREMIEQVRGAYDYVFADCPPVDIVADTAVINQYVDMTLFVVRVGLLERFMLVELERMYAEKRYRHLGILLNGAEESGIYGYKSGYYSGGGIMRRNVRKIYSVD